MMLTIRRHLRWWVFSFFIISIGLVAIVLPILIENGAVKLINERFPPRSTIEIQKSAIETSSKSLASIEAPNLAFSMTSRNLAGLLGGGLSAIGKELPLQIGELKILQAEQQIRFAFHFSGPLDSAASNVAGDAHGAVAVKFDGKQLIFTPLIDWIELSSLGGSNWRLPRAIADRVGNALTQFVENINGQIEPIKVDVVDQLSSPQTVTIAGRSIKIPAQTITAQSLLVDVDRVIWLAQINGTKSDVNLPAAGDFAAFKAAFLAKGGALLSDMPPDGLSLLPAYAQSLIANSGIDLAPHDPMAVVYAASWRSVHRLAGPDISVILPTDRLNSLVKPVLDQALQSAATSANISVQNSTFSVADGRVAVSATAVAVLPKPVSGKITFQVGISGYPLADEGRLALIPTIDEISITKLEPGLFEPAELVKSINGIVAALAAGINQVLPSIPIVLEPITIEEVDLAKSATETPGLALSPSTISVTRGRLTGTAILVTKDGIEILADFDIASPNLPYRAPGEEPAPYSGAVDTLKQAFTQRRKLALVDQPQNKVSTDVSWARLAEIVNAKWKDVGGIRATYRFDTGPQAMEPTEIRLVEKPTYTCEQKSCSFQGCSFSSCADNCQRDGCDWSCGLCADVPCPTFSEPFRTCTKCGPDPVCEASKAACVLGREPKYQACRASCDIKANADKAACDLQANLEKAKCDAVAVTYKAGCDLGNAIQQVAQQVGGIGKIGGDGRAVGTIQADAAALALTTEHPGLVFKPVLSGQLHVSGTIDFTPYDIGHLLVCPAKGKVSFASVADLLTQQLAVSASVEAQAIDANAPQTLPLIAHISSFNLKAKITPAPIESVLSQNPQLFAECNPVLTGTLAGLAIIGKAKGLTGDDIILALAGKSAAALFTGDVDYDVGGFDVPFKLHSPDLTVGSQRIRFQPHLTSKDIGAKELTQP